MASASIAPAQRLNRWISERSRPSSSAMMIPGSGIAKSRLNSHTPASINPSISSVVTSSMWSAIDLMRRGRKAFATSWR